MAECTRCVMAAKARGGRDRGAALMPPLRTPPALRGQRVSCKNVMQCSENRGVGRGCRAGCREQAGTGVVVLLCWAGALLSKCRPLSVRGRCCRRSWQTGILWAPARAEVGRGSLRWREGEARKRTHSWRVCHLVVRFVDGAVPAGPRGVLQPPTIGHAMMGCMLVPAAHRIMASLLLRAITLHTPRLLRGVTPPASAGSRGTLRVPRAPCHLHGHSMVWLSTPSSAFLGTIHGCVDGCGRWESRSRSRCSSPSRGAIMM